MAALAGRTMQERMVMITRNIAKNFFAILRKTSLIIVDAVVMDSCFGSDAHGADGVRRSDGYETVAHRPCEKPHIFHLLIILES